MSNENVRGRGRPKRRRRVREHPPTLRYEPVGIPEQSGRLVRINLDEAEALRLADLEAIYHEEAAALMDVSRSTYGRILESARHKVALALWGGLPIVIDPATMEVQKHSGDCLKPPSGRPSITDHSNGRDIPVGNAGRGCGAQGFCICPRCGLTREHLPGRPCKREQCPDCGVALMREGGEHHRAVLEHQSKKK